MDNRLKKFFTVFGCLVLTILLYLYMCMVVTPKDISNSGGPLYYRGMGFMSEPENSIDVMIYGNSDVYSGFIPARLFEEYGYTSYASGRANQTVGETVKLLEKTLETQKPKLVILETDCFFAKEKRVNMDTGNLLIAPFLYHSRWKEITVKDFFDIPNREDVNDINKGFLPSKLTYKVDDYNDYMNDNNKGPSKLSKKNINDIKHFIDICNRRGVKVLFLELPSPSSWNYNKHLAVANLADKYQVNFLDLNIPTEDYQVDMLRDFRDKGNHMNTTGASRATDYVGKYITLMYKNMFNDKRNQESFKGWHDAVKKYYEKI